MGRYDIYLDTWTEFYIPSYQQNFQLGALSGCHSINEYNILVFGGVNKDRQTLNQTFLCNTYNNFIQVSAINAVSLWSNEMMARSRCRSSAR